MNAKQLADCAVERYDTEDEIFAFISGYLMAQKEIQMKKKLEKMIQKKTDNPDFWHYPCEDKEDVPEDKESCLCVYDGGLYIGIYDAEKEKWFTDTGAEAVTPVRWGFTSDLI